jgi:hypothetical protein
MLKLTDEEQKPYPFATRYYNGGEYGKEKIRVLTLSSNSGVGSRPCSLA